MHTPQSGKRPREGTPLRRRPRKLVVWTARLILAGLSALIGLVVGEVGLRIAGYGAIHDTYSKPGIFWIHDDVLGWSHEPGAEDVYVGPRPWPVEFRTPIRINSIGLRGPEVGAKPEGGLRLLALGDSIVASFEVPYEESFVHLLGESLTAELKRPVQAIGAGVRGYGTDQSYLYYRERGRDLDPDLVVLVHTENDPIDIVEVHQMRRPFGKPVFALGDDGALALRGSPVPRYPMCSEYRLSSSFEIVRRDGWTARAGCRAQMILLDHSALVSFAALRVPWDPQLLRNLYHLGRPPAAVPPDDAPRDRGYQWELTHALIEELARTVRADGGEFLLVALDTHSLDPDRLTAAGISWVDLAPIEGSTHQEIRFRNDSHFNVEGHRRIAALLTPILAAQANDAHRASATAP